MPQPICPLGCWPTARLTRRISPSRAPSPPIWCSYRRGNFGQGGPLYIWRGQISSSSNCLCLFYLQLSDCPLVGHPLPPKLSWCQLSRGSKGLWGATINLKRLLIVINLSVHFFIAIFAHVPVAEFLWTWRLLCWDLDLLPGTCLCTGAPGSLWICLWTSQGTSGVVGTYRLLSCSYGRAPMLPSSSSPWTLSLGFIWAESETRETS